MPRRMNAASRAAFRRSRTRSTCPGFRVGAGVSRNRFSSRNQRSQRKTSSASKMKIPVRRLTARENSSRFSVSEALPLESKSRLTSPRISRTCSPPTSSSIALTSPVSSRPTAGSSKRKPSSRSSAFSDGGMAAPCATASSRASATSSSHSPKWRARPLMIPRCHSTTGSSASWWTRASRSKQKR